MLVCFQNNIERVGSASGVFNPSEVARVLYQKVSENREMTTPTMETKSTNIESYPFHAENKPYTSNASELPGKKSAGILCVYIMTSILYLLLKEF